MIVVDQLQLEIERVFLAGHAQRRAHEELGHPAVLHPPGDGADDGARRPVGALGAEPRAAPGDDAGDVGQGLDVVDQGRRRDLAVGAGQVDVTRLAAPRAEVAFGLDDLYKPEPSRIQRFLGWVGS